MTQIMTQTIAFSVIIRVHTEFIQFQYEIEYLPVYQLSVKTDNVISKTSIVSVVSGKPTVIVIKALESAKFPSRVMQMMH